MMAKRPDARPLGYATLLDDVDAVEVDTTGGLERPLVALLDDDPDDSEPLVALFDDDHLTSLAALSRLDDESGVDYPPIASILVDDLQVESSPTIQPVEHAPADFRPITVTDSERQTIDFVPIVSPPGPSGIRRSPVTLLTFD